MHMGRGKAKELSAPQAEIFRGYLQQACDSAGSASQLAEYAGVSQPAITKILRGSGASFSTVRKIAQYLGVSEADVIGGARPLPDGLELPKIIMQTPRLLATVEFGHYILGLDVDSINGVVERLVRARILITVELLLDGLLSEKKLIAAGALPGRPIK